MPKNLLITQCLQNDLVKPLDRYEALPNLLHIGYEESKRLMGEDPSQGPIAQIMQWAQAQDSATLEVIHIRDWHDPADPQQAQHLQHFGNHCIKNTPGAEFAFAIPADNNQNIIVDSLSLNDFHQTPLASILEPYKNARPKVGLVGVWTEAKISFLAYELKTRYPTFEIGLCSALTACHSRNSHFIALGRLERILGIKIYDSIGEFAEFLGGSIKQLAKSGPKGHQPTVTFDQDIALEPQDHDLLAYLFRDCRTAQFTVLDGGFSGNIVLGSESEDHERREQVPHVVKIGDRKLIGKERAAFERIESVLGNVAPRIVEFSDLEDRGAIKYRYASMGGTFCNTFQKLYMSGVPMDEIYHILNTVFVNQLGRLYSSVEREPINLLDYYCFSAKWADSVEDKVKKIAEYDGAEKPIKLPGDIHTDNIVQFYRKTLETITFNPGKSWYVGYIHGDLNGANIIIDDNQNVWLIDFFHTQRGHILKDLIKLENDILYIFTQINSEMEFKEACNLTNLLLSVKDLGRPLPNPKSFNISRPALLRAWQTIAWLRKHYINLIQSDRDPIQLFIGLLRYAVHTIGFDECTTWQKRWALYTAGECAKIITERSQTNTKLRVDFLPKPMAHLGITILPGRQDYARNLKQDILDLKEQGIKAIACLLPHDELEFYGVPNLLKELEDSGFEVMHEPIIDQKDCTSQQADQLISWTLHQINRGNKVLLHCAGGLGRSGMIAACCLIHQGIPADQAMKEVRRSRSERAIETKEQEDFIEHYEKSRTFKQVG